MASRKELLDAIYEAQRLHKKHKCEARAQNGEGRVDVFGMLFDRDIPVMFQPLKNLLGAYIDDPCQGVMVTTQRQLRVQRFTAAHELGHAVLGHTASLDEEEVLTRALFNNNDQYDSREVQANAFATELLTPQWLIVSHMQRQGWTRDDLRKPVVVYQLSLRMGSSYQATCYALSECQAIDRGTREALLAVPRRSIKQKIADPFVPANWYGDVWLITSKDNGMVLEGGRSDIVVVNIPEHASSGYVWQFGDLADAGLVIKKDGRQGPGSQRIGGISFRTVIAEAKDGAMGHINLTEVRPWQTAGEPLNSLELDVDLFGPVARGLLPAQREAALQVA